MSRNLYVYRIDLEQFGAIAGSRDKPFLHRILDQKRDEITFHDKYFGSAAGHGSYTPLARALEHLIDGTIDRDIRPLFQYEHAAVLIAAAIGESLDSDVLMESSPAFCQEVDRVIEKRGRASGVSPAQWPRLAKLLERGPYLKVPLDTKMRLGTGYVTKEEAKRARKATVKVDLESLAGMEEFHWPQQALEAAQAYREWLLRADEGGRGLFLHR
jgi:hypothetical protein